MKHEDEDVDEDEDEDEEIGFPIFQGYVLF